MVTTYPFHWLIDDADASTRVLRFGGWWQYSSAPPEDPPFVPPAYAGPDWYVSPSGSASGNGSADYPWNIDKALTSPQKVQPGHTVWLLGGRHYTLGIQVSLAGTAENPITIKPCPGHWPIIDGNRSSESIKNVTVLNIASGGHLILEGFELMNSDPAGRQIAEIGSGPSTARGSGIYVGVPGVKIRNLVIHDVGTGLGAWIGATDFESYGVLIYNCGWDAPDRGHGHNIYTQNQSGTKQFIQNICWGALGGYAFHGYTGSHSYLNGLELHDGVFYSGVLVGGGVDTHDCVMDSNVFLGGGVGIGYVSNSYGTILTGNWFLGELSLSRPDDTLAVTGNKFVGSLIDGDRPITIVCIDNADISDYTFSANTYWLPVDDDTRLVTHSGVGYYTFAQWQGTIGQDLDGTYNARNADATDDAVEITANLYDESRALLKVFNFGLAASKQVDLSGFASAGEWVRIRSILDYFGDVQTIRYDGSPITLDMQAASHPVCKPLGWDSELIDNSFPMFGAFILEKINAPSFSGRAKSTPGLGLGLGV